SSGTQRGLVVTNANDAANATTEALALLNNAETTANTVTDYLLITSSATDTTSDAIDVSDSDLFNAINIGTNFLVASGDSINDFTRNGLQVTSNALTLALQANKGLEVDANGLSLIDCVSGEILKYNGSNQWACAADNGTGAAPTLQEVYDMNETGGKVMVPFTSTDGAFLVRDTATPLGGTLLAVQNDTGATSYF